MKRSWWATAALAVACLALAAAAPVETAPAITELLSLEGVLERARRDAPQVSSSLAQAGSARAQIDLAKVPWLPSFAGLVSANTGLRNGNTLIGDANNGCINPAALGCSRGYTVSGNLDASFEARWLLLDFGRTSNNVRAAVLGSRSSEADVSAVRALAAVDAGTAFLALAGDLELIDARKKLVEERQRLLDVAVGRVTAGVAAPIEETRARVALETSKVDVENADAAAKNDAASLALALGMDPVVEVKVAPPKPLDVESDPAHAADIAEATRPELTSLKLRVDAAEADVDGARSGYLPSLSASASLGPGLSFYNAPGAEITEQAGIGATFSVPIFDAGIGASVAAAEANALVAKAILRERSADIRGEAAQAAIAVRAQTQSLTAATELSKQADQNYQQASGRYELGAAGLLELVDAETQQSDALLGVIRARFLLETAKLRLLAAIGSLGGTLVPSHASK